MSSSVRLAPLRPSRPARPAVRPVVPALLAQTVSRRDKRCVRLQWHDRVCTVSGNAVQMRIPLVGRVDADLATRLSAYLDHEWVGRPAPEGGEITSVATLTGQLAGALTLIVFLSVDRMPARQRLDDSRMARELQHAVDVCAGVR